MAFAGAGFMSMSKTEYLQISGNTNVQWYCTRTDCLDTPNQPPGGGGVNSTPPTHNDLEFTLAEFN